MPALVVQIASLFKLRIAVAITLSALAGLAISPGPAPPASTAAVLLAAVFLSAASAGAFNQYAERDLDARMQRTRGRPFVTGRFQAGPVWLAVIAALLTAAVSAVGWMVNLAAALYVFLGAFVYGVVYTVWLKRRSVLNIVVGGLAGSFAVLAGAAAVDPGVAPAPLILAVVLFLWTPPHFWSLATALRSDYAAAGVPMLPVVAGEAAAARVILAHSVALALVSLMPVAFGMGWIYLLGAAVGGTIFVARSVAMVRTPGRAAAMSNFRASLLQLGLLQLATIADRWIAL